MKKIFIYFFLLILSVSIQAEGHLKIKGIEIDGHINTFIGKMQNIGLTYNRNVEKHITEMEGSFAGYDGCIFYIYNTKITKTVYRVMVIFPLQSNCEEANEEFNALEILYTSKYGDDISEWTFAYKTECRSYGMLYELNEGDIYLKLLPSKNNAVEYADKINMSKNIQEDKTNALDDI